MPDSEAPKNKPKLWSAPYLIAIAAVVCTVLLCAGGCYLFAQLGRQLDPHYTPPEDIAAHEAALLKGGPAELDAKRVEVALVRASDAVVAEYPGLTWHWGEQAPGDSTCDPYDMFHGIKPVQIALRHILFEGVLTGKARERIVAALKEQAEALGVPGEESFTDSYGRAWVTFSEHSGSVMIGLVSGQPTFGDPDDLVAKEHASANVQARSACLFPQQYFTEHHLPVPSH